jgi:site-specific recombinase XerD
MDSLLARYDAARLAHLSPDRRRTALRVLGDLQDRVGAVDLAGVDARALRGHLARQLDDGLSPGTVRKHRAVVLAFYEWAYRERCVEAEVLLALRAVREPAGASREARPQPYKRWELRALEKALEDRWPKLAAQDADKWLARVRDGRSPYARVRSHAIRCQLDAIISLALHTGLRRGELFRLDVPCMHYHNEGVAVRGDVASWEDNCREVPFTDAARDAVERWIECRWFLRSDHERAWLSLHAEPTMSEPMTRASFDRLLATYVGPGWSFKRLRDTCAATWVRSGLELEHLRQLLGLASLHDTLPYARLVRGRVGERVQKLQPTFADLIESAGATA